MSTGLPRVDLHSSRGREPSYLGLFSIFGLGGYLGRRKGIFRSSCNWVPVPDGLVPVPKPIFGPVAGWYRYRMIGYRYPVRNFVQKVFDTGTGIWVPVPTAALNSDGHNFSVRALFGVFLDSMERSLSQESIHMPVGGNWCLQPS